MVWAKGDPKNPFRTYRSRPVETCRGPMTRRQIAEIAGVPLNTVHSRLWRKTEGEDLFAPSGLPPRTPRGRSGPYGKYKPRERGRHGGRSGLHEDKHFVETWAERKARRAKERGSAQSQNSP